MFFTRGEIPKFLAIALILTTITGRAMCQGTILDLPVSFKSGTVKTGNALEAITKETGFNFTYDSRLVDTERKVPFNYNKVPLRDILYGILQNDSIVFSVIDKYIIISRPPKISLQVTEAAPEKPDIITGKIVDEETGEALPFATIGFKNIPKGTVSNSNGQFGLKVPSDLYGDTLYVSFLGYFGREIPVQQAIGTDMVISMRREFISIPEIIIRNQIPREIIAKARRAIPSNYGESPVMMTAFYREGILRKNELQTYSEAILQIYKSSYTANLINDQIKIYKSRKIENTSRNDTLAIRLKAGLGTSLALDGIKNTFDFISAEHINEYNYRLTDIVKYDEGSAYAIDFEQKEGAEFPLFRGTIYINTSDLGIYNVDFEISPSKIDKIKESFVTSSTGGFTTWPLSVKYSVSYRKVEDRYFLSHVRGDLLFNSRQKRKWFNIRFKVFFELAITDTDFKNVKRLDREELAPIHSVFSQTITGYDADFWGDQNFLRPEDNLLQALKNMKVKLEELNYNWLP